VTGTATVGSTLTVSDGTWTEDPTSFSYGWQRCELLFGFIPICNPIEGVTTNTYTVARADIGFFLAAFVSATNAGGTTPAAAPVTATVPRPAPQIISLSPDNGTNNGGTVVTITGDYLTFSTGATFGAAAGTAYTVVDEFTATVTTPENVVGPVDVVLASPFGASDPSTFTYVLGEPSIETPPAITGVVDIGEILEVSDGTWTNDPTGFTYQWQRCDGTDCTDLPTQEAATYTVVEADAGFSLRAVVTATNAAGSGEAASAQTAPVAIPEPRIDSLDPTSGPETGGTTVTITGQYFTDATDVSFGIESSPSFTVDSDTQITASTPPGDPGVVGVSVTTPSGSGVAAGAFTYVEGAPTNIIPPGLTGSAVVGTALGITDGVWIPTPDSFTYQWFRCDDGCAAITDATAGSYTVTVDDVGFRMKAAVTATNGIGSATAETFETSVVGPPVPLIDTVAPASGPTAGGTSVILTGQFFTGTTSVTVGGVVAVFEVASDTTLDLITPPADDAGQVEIVVTNANGPGPAASFSYNDAPVEVSPPSLDNLTPTVGATVTVDPGVWTGEPTFTYRWGRCDPFPPESEDDCEFIDGATSASYTVTAADVGFTIGVEVVATNAFGSETSGAFAAAVVPTPI
jgi:hypothetical protein